MTTEELKQLVYQMAVQKGLGQYWPLIDYIVTHESGWNPNVQSSATDPNTGQRENSWGLFQNLISSSMGSGLGAGYSPQQLQDPQINAGIALEHIRKELARGAPIKEAVDDWTVTHGVDVNSIVGGQTQGTEGGVTMAATKKKTFWELLAELGLVTEPSDTTLTNGEVVHDPGGELRPGVTSDMVNQIYAQWLGTGADTGTATTTTTIPSAQETAVGQFDMEMALYEAEELAKTKGLDYAVQDFVNKLSAAQEGRLEATAAQEYARNLAPAGMTELKLGPLTGGISLGPAVPNTYSGMMELMNQGLPQAPDLQYQSGALPQMPPAGLPTTSTSTQTQVPMGGGLPTGNAGGGDNASSSHMLAIRNYMQRMGGMLGSAVTGGNLPVGG